MKNSSSDEEIYDRKTNLKRSESVNKISIDQMKSLPRNPSGTFTVPSETKVKSPYGLLTHKIRKLMPEELACIMGCGGESCKYCNSQWPVDSMAINGIFSNW